MSNHPLAMRKYRNKSTCKVVKYVSRKNAFILFCCDVSVNETLDNSQTNNSSNFNERKEL